jgi:probable HAF family extracellular repeat protein
LGKSPKGSIASAVSRDGTWVAGHDNFKVFRWSSAGGTTFLGDPQGTAIGISGDGSVIVGEAGLQFGVGSRGYQWSAGTGMVPLDESEVGGYWRFALSASFDGSVIVGSVVHEDNTEEAFLWSETGGVLGLGWLRPEHPFSRAGAVSGDGQIVVGFSYSANNSEAFRWTAADGMIGLRYLPDSSGISRSATAISSDGRFVVGRSVSTLGREVVIWTDNGEMIGLGDLAGGTVNSLASGVSADGGVVVGSGRTAAGDEAFIWTQKKGIQRLWDVLVAQGVNPAADGWTVITDANDVSANGRTVVGYGKRGVSATQGFVARLDPPSFPVEMRLQIIARPGGEVVIAWSSDLEGVRLLASEMIGPDAVWREVNLADAAPAILGQIRKVDSVGDTTRYYRLQGE